MIQTGGVLYCSFLNAEQACCKASIRPIFERARSPKRERTVMFMTQAEYNTARVIVRFVGARVTSSVPLKRGSG
jgi:hypothetical protein